MRIQPRTIFKTIYWMHYRFAKRSRKKMQENKKKAKLRNSAIFGELIKDLVNKVDVNIETTGKQYLEWSF